MKKILFGAAIAAAAIFTACDSDDSSTGGSSSGVTSCDLHVKMSMMGELMIDTHTCGESSDAATMRVDCDSAAQMLNTPMADDYGFDVDVSGSAKLGSGCPSGYVNKCTDPEEGITQYFYDAEDRDLSCEELMSDDEDDYGW